MGKGMRSDGGEERKGKGQRRERGDKRREGSAYRMISNTSLVTASVL